MEKTKHALLSLAISARRSRIRVFTDISFLLLLQGRLSLSPSPFVGLSTVLGRSLRQKQLLARIDQVRIPHYISIGIKNLLPGLPTVVFLGNPCEAISLHN